LLVAIIFDGDLFKQILVENKDKIIDGDRGTLRPTKIIVAGLFSFYIY
jgi:hypothetical protein